MHTTRLSLRLAQCPHPVSLALVTCNSSREAACWAARSNLESQACATQFAVVALSCSVCVLAVAAAQRWHFKSPSPLRRSWAVKQRVASHTFACPRESNASVILPSSSPPPICCVSLRDTCIAGVSSCERFMSGFLALLSATCVLVPSITHSAFQQAVCTGEIHPSGNVTSGCLCFSASRKL